jgi:hypothetical protein
VGVVDAQTDGADDNKRVKDNLTALGFGYSPKL